MATLREQMKVIMDRAGMSELFEASDHPYDCRCDKCLDWWMVVGPDEDGLYGPFTQEEILAAKEKS